MRKQKEILKKLGERKQEQIRQVHSGLSCFRDRFSEIPLESIPGISETGWNPLNNQDSSRNTRNSREKADAENLCNVLSGQEG